MTGPAGRVPRARPSALRVVDSIGDDGDGEDRREPRTTVLVVATTGGLRRSQRALDRAAGLTDAAGRVPGAPRGRRCDGDRLCSRRTTACTPPRWIGLLVAASENRTYGQLHLLGVLDNRPVQRPLGLIGLLGLFDVAPDLDTLLAQLRTIESLSD